MHGDMAVSSVYLEKLLWEVHRGKGVIMREKCIDNLRCLGYLICYIPFTMIFWAIDKYAHKKAPV